MKNQIPKYTVLRGEVFWLNFKIPVALFRQTSLKMQVIKHSLKTKTAHQAGAYAQIIVLRINEYCLSVNPNEITKDSIDYVIKASLSSLGVILTTKPKPNLLTQLNNEPLLRSSVIDKSESITAIFNLYRDEMLRASLWRVKSQHDIEASIRTLIELIGDTLLSDVTPSICRQYKELLLKYPIHRFKNSKLKNISFQNILKSGISYNTLSITTVNNQIRKVSTFFNWSVKQGYLNSNPMQGMRIRQKVSAKSARLPFSEDNLKSLFDSPIYTEHKFSKDYKYWLPLLGLYTGARLEELCQLYISDINISADIPYIDISDNHSDQHLKNFSSRRKVPIHPELFDLGFDRLIAYKQSNSCNKLFDYLIPQRQKFGHKPSIWFGKYKLTQGITDRKKVFHSFRHTVVANLIRTQAPSYELKSLLGHQHGSITFDLYGSEEVDLKSISNMLNKLSYKSVIANVKPWGYFL